EAAHEIVVYQPTQQLSASIGQRGEGEAAGDMDRGPECGQPAIELPHHCLIRRARRGDQAQRPAGQTLLLFLLSVGHMARGSGRSPQSAGAIGYHAVTTTKIHPPLLLPQPQSSGARHRLLLQPRQGPDNILLLPAPTLKRSLRPSAASSSISAVTRMAWASAPVGWDRLRAHRPTRLGPSFSGCRIRLLSVSRAAIRPDRYGRGALRPTARASAP